MVDGIDLTAVASRRYDGCSECKRKKAKCDPEKPVCGRCSRFPRFCKYENFVQSLSFSQTIADSGHEAREKLRPHQPTQPVSRYLVNHQKFFIHHFGTQTVTLLFPLAPATFTSQLVSTALNSRCLLFALLAASSSHYSRLTSDPSVQRTTLAYTDIAISSLRQALTTQSIVNIDHVATAIALCTNDICNGTKDSYRSHLAGARHLLQMLRMSQPRDLDFSFMHGLTRWFSIPDVSASASGSRTSVGPDEKHPVLDLIQRPSRVQVDDFCGYSLELMPLILSVEQLSSPYHGENLTDRLQEINSNDDDHNILLESQILLALSCPLELLVPDAAKGTDREIEMMCSHEAFIGATLLYLYRRIGMLPRDHPKVRFAISKIILALAHIPRDSRATILVLWPLFSAGCETDCTKERQLIDDRMANMQQLGLGAFLQARRVMHAYWSSDNNLSWSEYAEQTGMMLVLF